MSSIIHRIKTGFHRDLLQNPETHAWVLNLYRAGEGYPQHANDYFPYEHFEDKKITNQLKTHAQEEKKHEAFFTKLIRDMGEPLLEFKGPDIFNYAVKNFTPINFKIEIADSTETKRLKLAHFLIHAHFLEKRVAQSLLYHQEACNHEGKQKIAETINLIYQDELNHVKLTWNLATELLANAELETFKALHQKAEAKANLSFSQHQVRQFIRLKTNGLSRYRRACYMVYSQLMNMAVPYA
ncbi:hypothetical protein K1X76_08880 [bacterium]|nr:hypothetical protein [bacterium]